MAPSRWRRTAILLCALAAAAHCGFHGERYTGVLDMKSHPWLKHKKVFIDPGHGGLGARDRFRMGPGGITEEEVNLKVGLVLAAMLEEAGAGVKLSRTRDEDVPLGERATMAGRFGPDLLVSVHHNGSARRVDGVNYPLVLAWGTEEVNPASFDFAALLLREFHGIMDGKGIILSDFAVFPETGTRILRETRSLCPGVIGEAGFYSDEKQSAHLRDPDYNRREAEAYFTAISEYVRRGIPSAGVKVSCAVEKDALLKNTLEVDSPGLFISAGSGVLPGEVARDAGVDESSFRAALDGVPVPCRPVTNARYRVDYGKLLYPGTHALRFSFRNRRAQHSMVYVALFSVRIGKGDYDRLVREGSVKVRSRGTAREGVLMLRAALSMNVTGPGAGEVLGTTARGFAVMGDVQAARYFRSRRAYFFPGSGGKKPPGTVTTGTASRWSISAGR